MWSHQLRFWVEVVLWQLIYKTLQSVWIMRRLTRPLLGLSTQTSHSIFHIVVFQCNSGVQTYAKPKYNMSYNISNILSGYYYLKCSISYISISRNIWQNEVFLKGNSFYKILFFSPLEEETCGYLLYILGRLATAGCHFLFCLPKTLLINTKIKIVKRLWKQTKSKVY